MTGSAWLALAIKVDTDPRCTGAGAVVYDLGLVPGDRYRYDFDLCQRSDGWRQYDTDQDAWYFGIWYHRAERLVVTYAEGDLTLTHCTDDATWRAEVARMAAFFGDPPPAFVALAMDGTVTHYFDEEARP